MKAESNAIPSAESLTVGIVFSRYHEDITAALVTGAKHTFVEAGGSTEALTLLSAPGAFELPVIASELARLKTIDAVVAVGCVITGETTHDQHIASSVAAGLQQVAIREGKPVTFGVLTCATREQAAARAGGEKGNKGAEAMAAAIAACHAIRSIHAQKARR